MEKCKVKSPSNSQPQPQGRCLTVSSKTDAVVVPTQQYEAPEQVKVAAIALSLNIRLRSANMPPTMQEHALRHTSNTILHQATSSNPISPTRRRRPNLTLLARSLKQEFDKVYGPAWHCVAGKSFGSFVTHTPAGFIYFTTLDDSLSFLLFKTEVHRISHLPEPALPFI